jgi:hypothetical protein
LTQAQFDPSILSARDHLDAAFILGSWATPEPPTFLAGLRRLRAPDLVICAQEDALPYLYRWRLVHHPKGNVYFHIQVRSDPNRPLHDHPYDNSSNILTGGYIEFMDDRPESYTETYHRVPGGFYHRKAEWAHRLVLPEGVPYSMSLFTTGPVRRDWGFWFPDGWRSYKEVIGPDVNGVSQWKPGGMT